MSKNNVSISIFMMLSLSKLLTHVNAGVTYIFTGEKNSHYELDQQNDQLAADIANTGCFLRGSIINKPNATFGEPVWVVGDVNSPYAILKPAINGTRDLMFETCAKLTAKTDYEDNQARKAFNNTPWIPVECMAGGLIIMFALAVAVAIKKCKADRALQAQRMRLLPPPVKAEQGEDIALRALPSRTLMI